MKTSAYVLKKTGVTCTEFLITLITLLALNAIFIAPVVKFVQGILSRYA